MCFEETPLGEVRGAFRQFRGLHGGHAREYDDSWEIHRDTTDPRVDPFGHLINDAPYVLGAIALIGGLLALLIIATEDSKNNKGGEK